ncbi:formate dehydrogenase accessory sulfurtransferase FdhD [Paracidovorax citrulli]|nr:Protein FdhD [Paracidovorax citrulli]UMT89503.1 formate dehydrogenase accessory sulfurtransferase FdhD [Paracidovorax citrulli]UMT93581.1 formate dehydrogenase accessory sulfurtransferase FdhD [Paracidovorax citrulli]SDJ48774.1 FdhD protein [Paracidovorax citrulli]
MTVPDDDFTAALLAALAELDAPQGVSLPRLAKRLGQPGSAVLRRLHLLGDAVLGGTPGPGWVRVAQDGDRWLAHLTGAGRVRAAASRGADACTMPAAAGGPGALGGEDGEGDEAAAAPVPEPVVARAVQRHAGVSGDLPAATGAMPEDALAWLDDAVASEVPVALVFNGLSHAVMMATPTDLQAFALGFALSEGLIDTPADCRGIEVFSRSGPQAGGGGVACEVHLEIATRCFARLKERRRALAGRTGCGLCGIDSLQALDLVPERVRARPWAAALPAGVVLRAVAAMPALQVLNAAAGALHAAAWATPEGELTDLLEDVGRHNALDKLIGRLALQGRSGEDGFVVMSSRASYELVRKCARLDIPLLATVSAPTSLAVDLAAQAGIALWGLCRPPRAVRYTAGAGS